MLEMKYSPPVRVRYIIFFCDILSVQNNLLQLNLFVKLKYLNWYRLQFLFYPYGLWKGLFDVILYNMNFNFRGFLCGELGPKAAASICKLLFVSMKLFCWKVYLEFILNFFRSSLHALDYFMFFYPSLYFLEVFRFLNKLTDVLV